MQQDKIEEFLDIYGFILLYVFIASLLVNPFIVLAMGSDNFTYKVELGTMTHPHQEPIIPLEKYEEISLAEHEKKQEEARRIETIGYTALLGWMATSKRFKKGINTYAHKYSGVDWL